MSARKDASNARMYAYQLRHVSERSQLIAICALIIANINICKVLFEVLLLLSLELGQKILNFIWPNFQ